MKLTLNTMVYEKDSDFVDFDELFDALSSNVSALPNITRNFLPPRSFPDIAKALFHAKLERIGYGYILVVICFAGVCGNVLVFCVLTRKALRTSTTAVYLRVLAISDTCVLLAAIFRYQTYKILMTEAASAETMFFFDPYIQVYVEPLFYIFLGISSFVTLLLSTERYMAVKYPLAIKRTCTVQLAGVCIAAIVLIVAVITIPMFFNYEIRHMVFHGMTIPVAHPTEFGLKERYICKYSHYILPLVWYICPWIVLAVVNTLLAYHVRKSTRMRIGGPNVANINRNLSILIISVVVIYVVCNFPICIISFLKVIGSKGSNCLTEVNSLKLDYSDYYLVSVVVADILNVLNSCANIVVYCVVGSKFRLELKKLILCEPCHKHTAVHINNTIQITLTRDGAVSLPNVSSPSPPVRELQGNI